MDVGANKGYSIISMLKAIGFNEYSATSNLASIRSYCKSRNLTLVLECGVCKDCMEPHVSYGAPTPFAANQTIRVYGFDPIPSHAAYLKDTFRSRNNVKFDFRQLALGHEHGKTTFPDSPSLFGVESAGLRTTGAEHKSTQINVTVSTLNDELRDEGIDFIDVLMTDTEGNDFNVAEGARSWIAAGKVGLYMFEIHRDRNKDPKNTLGAHIRRLETAKYRCFAPHSHFTSQISHECWDTSLEHIFGWMNVLCVNERLPHLMETMSSITTFARRFP